MYSLGGTLFHALTGKPPFDGDDVTAVVKARFTNPPPKPSSLRPELSPQIDALVTKMLAFKKEDRFPSFEALIEEFKKVMTTGLETTRKMDRPEELAAAPKPGTGGTRKMTMKPRRTGMLKKTGTLAKTTTNVSGDVADMEGSEASPGAETAENPENAEEEEGGNLGLKVIGVVVGVIALIGVVAGGLVWYQVADKKAREAERQAQISREIGKARAAIRDTAATAAKSAEDFEALVAKAEANCQKATDDLKGLMPDFADKLKPEPTKELLDAISDAEKAAQERYSGCES